VNPVGLLERHERPKVGRSTTAFLEVPDAARLLWAAATYPAKRNEPEMGLAYALIGTFILTGGRQKEVVGLAATDVRLDLDTITFRPHPWHEGGRLKTEGAERTIPLWPQLREILEEYLAAHRRHLPGRVLFPSPHVEADRPLTDLRDLLDRVAIRAGFLVSVLDDKTGKQSRTSSGQLMWTGRRIRTRVFRQTYCAARLQTLDHGRPVSLYTVAQELGHESEEMVRRVYARLGKIRHRAESPEFRPEQWFEVVGGQLVAKRACAQGYHKGDRVLDFGLRRAGLARFPGTIGPTQAVSLYGSVAQLDRALASGARGRAFESRRAHSGRSSPVDTSVSRGSSFPSPAPSRVTFRVTNPTFPPTTLLLWVSVGAFEAYITPSDSHVSAVISQRRMASPAINSARPVVLVVDDEPVALAVLQRTLEPHYHVLTASDGLEALTIIGAWGPVIRVVVTDVRMPRLSGPALAAHLARLDRSPAILFVSGFTDPDVPGDVLAKPFPPDALLGAVARLLESQDRSGSRPE
jgi:integrase